MAKLAYYSCICQSEQSCQAVDNMLQEYSDYFHFKFQNDIWVAVSTNKQAFKINLQIVW